MNILLTILAAAKSKIQAIQCLEKSLAGLQISCLLGSSHGGERAHAVVPLFPPKGTNPMGGSTPVTSSKPSYIPKHPPPDTITSGFGLHI